LSFIIELLTFAVVGNAGEDIPRATIAFMVVRPPTLAAERSRERLDVASMMMIV
jgi:hypothetical protein